jgi:hypothetical protein
MKLLIPVVAGALCCGVASANYFHNPGTNTQLNVGSAPSPSPDDLHRAEGALEHRADINLRAMLGKPVFGKDREYLGSISDIDTDRNLAAVRVAQNEAVALPARDLIDDGSRVIAPTVSKPELLAMPRIPESELR